MQIIKDQTIVADHWQHVATDASDFPTGDIIVTLPLWQESKTALLKHPGQLGLRLAGDAGLNGISDDLQHFALIALEFPAFRDGRGYSLARRLRLHLGYQGEIRAIGNILRDQLAYMARVGINAFELDEGQNLQDALKAFSEISVKYQAASDEALPLYRRWADTC